MRLTCPNCAAQYEVDDRVIPAGGRDVQCSGCGQTWFQPSAGAAPVAAPEAAAEAGGPVAQAASGPLPRTPDDTGAADDPEQEGEPARPADAASGDETAGDETGGEETAEEETALNAPPPPRPGSEPEPEPRRRRSLDEAVLKVLREEAEREARARRGKGHGIETQGELALSPAPPHPEQPRPEQPPEAVPGGVAERGADADRARQGPLPDVEGINSTLRATSERGREPAALDAPETLRRRRNGFRLGFGLSLGLVLLLLALYLGAPRLGARLPAAAPALNSYVAAVDRGRIWLDRTLAATVDALSPQE
ncbi:MAG: zinc-ribbon domain-containing protein [Defluviimonas sp.]|nr:zinc-ribbon domain-containing protein [Defluviimonas sp.]